MTEYLWGTMPTIDGWGNQAGLPKILRVERNRYQHCAYDVVLRSKRVALVLAHRAAWHDRHAQFRRKTPYYDSVWRPLLYYRYRRKNNDWKRLGHVAIEHFTETQLEADRAQLVDKLITIEASLLGEGQ